MTGRRIFLTGSRGFLGHWLSAALIRRGVFLVELVRDKTRHENRDVITNATVYGEVENLRSVERAISDYECDTVIHLAAQAQHSIAISDPIHTLETNVAGTWNVLEAARRQKVRRIIISSSDKCYIPNGDIRTSEGSALGGTAPYEVSKSCSDLIANAYMATYGLSIGITRCSNLYGGGHLNFSTLIPGTIKRVLEGRRPVVKGQGKMIRQFLYVEDAVEGYLKLLESDHTGPFNLGGGDPIEIIDIVRKILKIMNSSLEPEIEGESKFEIQKQGLDSTRAETLLGWKPIVTLDEGLRRTITWFRDYLDPNPHFSLVVPYVKAKDNWGVTTFSSSGRASP